MNHLYVPKPIEAIEVTKELLADPRNTELWPEGWSTYDVIAGIDSWVQTRGYIWVEDSSGSTVTAYVGDFIVRTSLYEYRVVRAEEFNFLFRPEDI